LTARFRRVDGRVLRIGHRGAAALEPENTLRSFERAVELGVDFVELDVLDLADGTLVLAHSDNLLEVSHGLAAGSVRPLTLTALREAAPELPTLAEGLAYFAERGRGVGLHVDLKCGPRAPEVAEALRRHGLIGRSFASSPSLAALRLLRETAPELARGLGYPSDRFGLVHRRAARAFISPALAAFGKALPYRLGRWLKRAGASVASLHYAVLSAATVESCHAAGVAVFTWTVNEPELLEHVVELGVDGVVTDDPRIFPG
jgi:glycerophosphoryl diester phosphodiesterase